MPFAQLAKSLRVFDIFGEQQDNWAENKEYKKTKSMRKNKNNMKNIQLIGL